MLARELDWFDAVTSDLFGFHALQVEECGIDFLRANRMPQRYCAGVEAGCPRCLPEQLPFISQGLDLVVLPHVLEFSANPHQVLREAERILRPEGRLLIAGFNPLSLWGLRRVVGDPGAIGPWHGRFIHLARLKDWPGPARFRTGRRPHGLLRPAAEPEPLAIRLRLPGGGWRSLVGPGRRGYLIHAVKRVQGMRLIAPKWEGKWRAPPGLGQSTRTSSQRNLSR